MAWWDLSNLKTFDRRRVPSDRVSVTQLLNFFERAPLLRKIRPEGAFPISPDTPPGRVVSLPNPEFITIAAQPTHAILLNHLPTPVGASLSQDFDFNDDKSPIPIYLGGGFENIRCLKHVFRLIFWACV